MAWWSSGCCTTTGTALHGQCRYHGGTNHAGTLPCVLPLCAGTALHGHRQGAAPPACPAGGSGGAAVAPFPLLVRQWTAQSHGKAFAGQVCSMWEARGG